MSDDESSDTATGLTSVLAFSMARDNGGFIRRPHWQDWLHYEKPEPSVSWPSGWRWNRVGIEDGAGFGPDDILATDWQWTAIPAAAAQVPDRSALPLPLQIMACACRSYGTNANGGSRNDCAGVRLVGNELVACKCICHPENG